MYSPLFLQRRVDPDLFKPASPSWYPSKPTLGYAGKGQPTTWFKTPVQESSSIRINQTDDPLSKKTTLDFDDVIMESSVAALTSGLMKV